MVISTLELSPFRTSKDSLSSFGFRPDMKCLYDYDMGDLWQHELVVEGEGRAETGGRYPLC